MRQISKRIIKRKVGCLESYLSIIVIYFHLEDSINPKPISNEQDKISISVQNHVDLVYFFILLLKLNIDSECPI